MGDSAKSGSGKPVDVSGTSAHTRPLASRFAFAFDAMPVEMRPFAWAALILFALTLAGVTIAYWGWIWRGAALMLAAVVGTAVVLATLWLIWVLIAQWSRSRARQRAAEEESRRAVTAGRAELLKSIENGESPAIAAPVELLLRNSESLWFMCTAGRLRDGVAEDQGTLFITSLRVSFVSAQAPFEVPMKDINAVRVANSSLQLVGRSSTGSHTLRVPDAELAAAHLRRAVKAYHRQLDIGFEPDASRHIPQDVKTAVWQRDGGRCVQCGASDYLEFDHIIPHARGGANTVNNVQLLCRRCNISKGASI